MAVILGGRLTLHIGSRAARQFDRRILTMELELLHLILGREMYFVNCT